MSISRGMVGLGFVLAVTACGSNHGLIQQRQRSVAPQGTHDVGTVLQGASEGQVEKILAAHPAAQVRVLNSQHGMYEIFNVDIANVRQEFDGLSEPNQYFTREPAGEVSKTSIAGPTGYKIGNLNPCADGKSMPEAVLTLEAPSNGAMDLGSVVKFNGSASKSTDGSLLKMAMVSVYPDAAGKPQQTTNGATLSIVADTLGLYQVFLVVQDGENACAMDAIRFVVSANRPYNGPNAPAMVADLSQFSHLATVHAPEAWKISQGDGLTIAIIDSGVDYNHPSLAPNMAVNAGEIPANGIDDDKNGFVDDVVGYDFANNDSYPYDDDSHGTHVAGLAASRTFGLAPHAKILAVKAMTPAGGDVASVAAGIRYAVDRSAKIINVSLGTASALPSPALVAAANYAEAKGALIVTSSGNGDPISGKGMNIDVQPQYPASLDNSNVLTVGASDAKESLASYSNFGVKSVKVVAPGGTKDDYIYSCAFENPQKQLLIGMAGTSMATPIVSGIAALVWSKNPTLKPAEVIQILEQSGPKDPNLTGLVKSGRHVDALGALQSLTVRNVLF